jgi:hypothetical protein
MVKGVTPGHEVEYRFAASFFPGFTFDDRRLPSVETPRRIS